MEQRDLGVQADYVERAFQTLEMLSPNATREAREYFLSRALQLQDLAHIQQNRPLGRPGTAGWRFVAPPHVTAHVGRKTYMANRRLEGAYDEPEPAGKPKFPRGYV